MKILFISDFILAEEQGAKQSTKAHYQTLKDIFGVDNVDVAALNSTYESKDEHIIFRENKRTKSNKLKSIVQGVPFLISKHGENNVLKLCKKNHYSCVFIDHSIYGHMIKRIKREIGIPVVSYFHGVMQYQNKKYKEHNQTTFFYFLPSFNMKQNEIDTVKYSDICLLLNKRDNDNFKKYYGHEADEYLPVYYIDTAKINTEEKDNLFRLLFVGGYFWPNIHGITWFVKSVMPKLSQNIVLEIVGNNMDKLKNNLAGERVTIRGRVESLDEFYNKADVVVGPIFKGEGMKTKTCEALMYGKIYLGTDEALEGYEDLNEYRCNTADEFVHMIELLTDKNLPKYNENLRNIYLEKYSPQMAKARLTKIFKELGVIENNRENCNDNI
ncbi:glycosyltransferase [Hungatella hathewayi]|jgi:glycosyltransferase involved in cell wall biosynthesis|uniref:glycosyltransferase n=1 Tax=Hungatella hathewayi TaxID=154046 RepID=UPI0006C60144|nr:glycosyltransferase family 4 protein [Hungatella hathewayi]CUQ58164.1 group 1 glycosyl transferase [Hungatella hathewayi]